MQLSQICASFLSARIDEGHPAVTLLREYVLQGKMNERGNYGAHLLDVDD